MTQMPPWLSIRWDKTPCPSWTTLFESEFFLFLRSRSISLVAFFFLSTYIFKQRLGSWTVLSPQPTIELGYFPMSPLTPLPEKSEPRRYFFTGVRKFNQHPEKGIAYMIEHLVLEDDDEEIAKFLFECPHLNKTVIGEYISLGWVFLFFFRTFHSNPRSRNNFFSLVCFFSFLSGRTPQTEFWKTLYSWLISPGSVLTKRWESYSPNQIFDFQERPRRSLVSWLSLGGIITPTSQKFSVQKVLPCSFLWPFLSLPLLSIPWAELSVSCCCCCCWCCCCCCCCYCCCCCCRHGVRLGIFDDHVEHGRSQPECEKENDAEGFSP